MTQKNSQELAKRVCHYHEKVAKFNKTLTYNHFKSEGIWKTTICRILQRFVATGTSNYKFSKGRTPRVWTPKIIHSVGREYKKNQNVSERILAQKLNVSKYTIHVVKTNKLGLKTYKANKTPKYIEGQKKRAKTNCRKIVEKRLVSALPKLLVIDDETYVPIDPNDIPDQKYFTCASKNTVDENLNSSLNRNF